MIDLVMVIRKGGYSIAKLPKERMSICNCLLMYGSV